MNRMRRSFDDLEARWKASQDHQQQITPAVFDLSVAICVRAAEGKPFPWGCDCCRWWIDDMYASMLRTVEVWKEHPDDLSHLDDQPDDDSDVPEHIIQLAEEGAW